jgi:hypothetical protein
MAGGNINPNMKLAAHRENVSLLNGFCDDMTGKRYNQVVLSAMGINTSGEIQPWRVIPAQRISTPMHCWVCALSSGWQNSSNSRAARARLISQEKLILLAVASHARYPTNKLRITASGSCWQMFYRQFTGARAGDADGKGKCCDESW